MSVEGQNGSGVASAAGSSGVSPAQVSAGAEDASSSEATGASGSTENAESGQTPNAPLAATPPPYTPNFKYKVLKEEKEFPEWAKSFVKDQELEKQLRDTFERADGLPIVKEHRDRLEAENTYMRENFVPFIQNAQQALAFKEQGDLHSFFKAVNVSETDVLKYALQRIQLRDNPAQLQQHDQAAQLRYENAMLKRDLEGSTTEKQTLAVQQRSFELDSFLARPDVAPGAAELDTRLGKPGAFREEVIKRGKAYAAAGQDITVEQAVQEVLALAGWKPQAAPVVPTSGAAETALGDGGSPQIVPPSQKAVLPNIKGKGTSPVKKQLTSIAEIRKHAASMRGTQ